MVESVSLTTRLAYAEGHMSDESTSRLKSTKRNDACPCGSGKKYKRCHLAEDQAAQNAADAKSAEEAIAAAAAAEEAEDKTDGAGAKKALPATPKGTRPRGKGRGAAGAQSKSAKPNNLPRRKAV